MPVQTAPTTPQSPAISTPDPEIPEVIGNVDSLLRLLPSISDAQAAEMREVAARYPFRIPRYYVEQVLRDDPADPLWELTLPGNTELFDAGTERWDAFQLAGKVAEHPRWIQKYRYEVLLRMTNFCSGLCRYCYLKNRENIQGFLTHADIDDMFNQAEATLAPGGSGAAALLREIVLSGGDPMTVPGDYLEHLAERIDRLNARLPRRITVTVHTREPVWFPTRVLRTPRLLKAMERLRPSSYILHVVHPREVTPKVLEAIACLAALTGGSKRQPLMMTQHPVFRGINNSAATITEMYDKLDAGDVVVKPYYLIHPFPDGTLPRHRLTLRESQQILRGLASAPGTRVPLLTVPTPMGKCVVGPWDELVDHGGYHILHTKDGVPVEYTTGEVYNPAERRSNIPVLMTIGGVNA
jgi:lysine 2,3-aminomutase